MWGSIAWGGSHGTKSQKKFDFSHDGDGGDGPSIAPLVIGRPAPVETFDGGGGSGYRGAGDIGDAVADFTWDLGSNTVDVLTTDGPFVPIYPQAVSPSATPNAISAWFDGYFNPVVVPEPPGDVDGLEFIGEGRALMCLCPMCSGAPIDPNDPQGFVPPTTGTAGNGLPYLDWAGAAAQLTRTNLAWTPTLGNPITVSYAFRSTAPTTMPNGTGDFSRFNANQIEAAEDALQLWADVAGITFTRVGSGTTGEGAYSDSATILFSNYATGAEGAAAFAYYPFWAATAPGNLQGDVWVNSTFDYNFNPVFGQYGPQILAHEIGHAIGLAHPADYDASDGEAPTYDDDATYYQDSRAYTIMSYFGSGFVGHALGAFAAGPQLHDIAAAQRLYGANMTTRTGDTVYGYNSNTGREHYTITSADSIPVFAVWDAGGIDTFNFSIYNSNSEIDLRQMSFSSVGTFINPVTLVVTAAIGNISIANGVVIENAYGGGGNDTIHGNSVANELRGNGGADTLNGDDGDDALLGGAGGDTLNGGNGTDTATYWNAGAGVIVNLATGGTGGDAAGDTYSSIERIEGSAYDDTLTGNGAANVILGGAGNDIIDGGAGADTMVGNAGDDIFYIDNAGDGVVEALAGPAGGTDTIRSTVGVTVGTNVENLQLLGTADWGVGNTLGNAMTGNASNNSFYGLEGDDIIDGGAGADLMIGHQGNDTYYVDNAGDNPYEGNAAWGTDTVISALGWTLGVNFENLILSGTAGNFGTGNSLNNSITGNSGNNQLFGLEGDDVLNGGTGADLMLGHQGNDTYYIDNAGDNPYEGNAAWGTDTVISSLSWTLGANLENLTLTGSAVFGTGNSLHNHIIGNAGNNQLYGLEGNDALSGEEGADLMIGYLGDDTYYVDNAGDNPYEGNAAWGHDTVYSSIGWTLGANLEDLYLIGLATFGTGNALNNRITGNDVVNSLYGFDGNDILDGGIGADTMIGHAGDDTYMVDNTGDFVFEGLAGGAGGTDVVQSSVNWTLGANFENLLLVGAATSGTGNELANVITGNAGNNSLDGAAGNDTLTGGGGDDTYIFRFNQGSDIVTDFTAGAGVGDVLRVLGFGAAFDSYAEMIAAGSQVGADVVFNFGNGQTLTLNSVTLGNLVADDFLFV